MKKRVISYCFGLFLLLACVSSANAGIPVIDGAAIAQAVISDVETVASWAQQYSQMTSQLSNMTQQLQQMQQTYNSMEGVRGMGNLTTNTSSMQYLPNNYSSLTNGFGNSSSIVSGNQRVNLANTWIDPNSQTGLDYQSDRNQAGVNAAAAQASFAQASSRISDLTALLGKVNNSPDSKDIADLQAAIQVEQAMIQNENVKLNALIASEKAQEQLQVSRDRDNCMAKYSNNTISAW